MRNNGHSRERTSGKRRTGPKSAMRFRSGRVTPGSVVALEEDSVEQSRARLRRLPDQALLRFGQSARYMCSPAANHGAEPGPPFDLQLNEGIAEWRRRHTGELLPLAD